MANVKPPAPSDRRFGVHVYGAKELRQQFKNVNMDLKDLTKVHKTIAREEVLPEARRLVPVKSGRLKRTLRATATQRYGEVRAGYGRESSVPYAAVIEYGGYNNIRPRAYMRRAVSYTADKVLHRYDREIRSLLRQNGIENR